MKTAKEPVQIIGSNHILWEKKIFSRMKKWVKYTIALVILVGLAVGGYYLYSYIENQFFAPYAVVVAFKTGTTEEQAIAVMTKYGDTALPLHYDRPDFARYQNYPLNFEFMVKGWSKFISITTQIRAEPIVQGVNR
jgi:hypothetical protein